MPGENISRHPIALTLRGLVLFTTLISIAPALIGCRTSIQESRAVSINAPSGGVVRSVLVNEGSGVDKDAVIIEIAVPGQNAATQPTKGGDQNQTARTAQNDLAAAEAAANRVAADLRRIEPLVKRGLASQAELDKARGQVQDAQERVRLAKARVETAESNRNQPSSVAPTEEIVSVRAPANGVVQRINVRAGEQVTSGQTLATLNSRS